MAFARKSVAPKIQQRVKRKARIRGKVFGTAERPRLSIFRSEKHMYAQVIDDMQGKTLLSMSTVSKSLRDAVKDLKPAEAAKKVGQAVAEACKAQNIEKVVFDRNGFMYHGRVKQLADGAREQGLSF